MGKNNELILMTMLIHMAVVGFIMFQAPLSKSEHGNMVINSETGEVRIIPNVVL